MIKHSISKDPVGDRVGVELIYKWVELGAKAVASRIPDRLETRCGRESHTRPRVPSETPDGVDPNIRRTRKTQRDGHNSGVKIWSLCSVSSTLSHATPWTTLSNPCNKVIGKNIVKEVFLRRFFLRPSLLRLLSLRRYVSSIYMYISAWIRSWLYNNRKLVSNAFVNSFVRIHALKETKISSCQFLIYRILTKSITDLITLVWFGFFV